MGVTGTLAKEEEENRNVANWLLLGASSLKFSLNAELGLANSVTGG